MGAMSAGPGRLPTTAVAVAAVVVAIGVVGLVAGGAGCRQRASGDDVRVPDEPARVGAPPGAPTFDAAPRPGKIVARSADRCAECHGAFAEEWAPTPHARASTSPGYRALRATVADGATCDGCHAALTAALGADHAAAREGVTCDVCHTIAAVDVAATPHFALALHEMVKYGPRCDAEDNHFHRMGCSPLHGQSELCAACHQWIFAGPAGPVPAYTTYDEWKASPSAAAGESCQDCHMPGRHAEIADGEGERDDVPHHGFFGDGSLRRGAARLAMTARADPGGADVTVEVDILNTAGHALPTGFPAKQVVLTVELVDGGGAVVGGAERVFARRLVDAAGAPAPYPRAVRVAADDRLVAKRHTVVPLVVAAPGAARARATLRWRSVDPALAAALAAPIVVEDIASIEVKVGRKGHR